MQFAVFEKRVLLHEPNKHFLSSILLIPRFETQFLNVRAVECILPRCNLKSGAFDLYIIRGFFFRQLQIMFLDAWQPLMGKTKRRMYNMVFAYS